jgi:hypothetical protein
VTRQRSFAAEAASPAAPASVFAVLADVIPGLAATRRALHAVAEGLLAAPQYRATGTIRLAARPGGFTSTHRYEDVQLVAVEGTDLLVVRGGVELRLRLSGTCGELAAAAGLPLGGLEDLYAGSLRPAPSTRVEVDADAAAILAAGWSLGDRALRMFAGEVATVPPAPVIWPEHFDVSISLDGVNYGVSPCDGTVPVPYAYVAPATPPTGRFWNQAFGAARPLAYLPDQAEVSEFFRAGRRLARGPS